MKSIVLSCAILVSAAMNAFGQNAQVCQGQYFPIGKGNPPSCCQQGNLTYIK